MKNVTKQTMVALQALAEELARFPDPAAWHVDIESASSVKVIRKRTAAARQQGWLLLHDDARRRGLRYAYVGERRWVGDLRILARLEPVGGYGVEEGVRLCQAALRGEALHVTAPFVHAYYHRRPVRMASYYTACGGFTDLRELLADTRAAVTCPDCLALVEGRRWPSDSHGGPHMCPDCDAYASEGHAPSAGRRGRICNLVKRYGTPPGVPVLAAVREARSIR